MSSVMREKTTSDVIIVSGPPGSGKGAMSGDYIDQHSKAQHVSAGDLVRGIRAGEIESTHSPIVLDSLKKREYMPDETFASIVLEKITANPDATLTFLDGFPQQTGDWEYFHDQLEVNRLKMLGAVCLWATEDVCVDRMKFRGMRNGEYVRNQHTELEDYYRDRYRIYMEKHHRLAQMFAGKRVEVKMFDVNQNLIDEETRQRVSKKFANTVLELINKNGDRQ